MRTRASPAIGLGFAAVYALGVLLLQYWAGPVLPFHAVGLVLAGVALAAYLFSWLPALLLFLASMAIASFMNTPGQVSLRVSRPGDLARLAIYTAANLVVIVGFHRLHRTVAALRRTEESHRLLLESAADGILVLDRDLRFLDANPRAREILGYSLEELRCLTLRSVARYPSPEGLPIAIDEVLAGATSVRERRIYRKDGTPFTAEVSARLLRDGRVLAILRDVSERRRVAEALVQSEGRFRRFSEATTEGIVIHENGVILDANSAFAGILGYTVNEVIRCQVWDFIAPDFRDAVREQIVAGREQPYESMMLHRDGSQVPVEVRAKMIPFEGRRVRVAALRDLRERRRFEERLREAQKMEAVGRLAGGVAHDFNNLLTVITGYANMLAAGLPEASEPRRCAEEVLNAAQRAAGLSNQLLAFSRRQVMQPRVLDLNGLLAGMESLLRRAVGEQIVLTLDLAAAPANVKADPTQLEQVVMNLALNARDAMAGGGRLGIRTANVEPERAYVLLAVSDTGHGMDEETRSHVFEPFFSTKTQGAGLGLATTYGIVKQHGGDIRVTSEPGHGATFEIRLPRTEGEPAEAAPAPGPPERGAETILVVEDEPAVRRMICTILHQHGYQVLDAANPAEALELISGQPGRVDLLLTDVIMPGMSGRELADRLLAERPELKVLFISGYTDDVLADAVGSLCLLRKPFTPGGLASKVRETLNSDCSSP